MEWFQEDLFIVSVNERFYSRKSFEEEIMLRASSVGLLGVSQVEAVQTRTSNEYEEEYGLFLYNAM